MVVVGGFFSFFFMFLKNHSVLHTYLNTSVKKVKLLEKLKAPAQIAVWGSQWGEREGRLAEVQTYAAKFPR